MEQLYRTINLFITNWASNYFVYSQILNDKDKNGTFCVNLSCEHEMVRKVCQAFGRQTCDNDHVHSSCQMCQIWYILQDY